MDFDPECARCPRLADHLRDMRARYPDYHNAPVPPFGARSAPLVIVGLAPGAHGANATGRPFTGDFAGVLLYRCLHRLGLASRPEALHANDGLRLKRCRITNAVKCLPPGNKPTTAEADCCSTYLRAELSGRGGPRAILALGQIAHRAVLRVHGVRLSHYRFGHAAEHQLPGGRVLVDSYHCSRYNTQTGRLTETMFMNALERAAAIAYG